MEENSAVKAFNIQGLVLPSDPKCTVSTPFNSYFSSSWCNAWKLSTYEEALSEDYLYPWLWFSVDYYSGMPSIY